jgi:hypothetical protein
MENTMFKSDSRTNDTKSVTLNYQRDARLLAHLKNLKGQTESDFWRRAAYFYLDFFDWLAAQPDPPGPGRPFVYYRDYLESRAQGLALGQPAQLNPDDLAQAILPALLPAMRQVVQAALDTALANLTITADKSTPDRSGDLVDLFSPDLVLE